MTGFSAHARTFVGGLTARAAIDDVFPLFSPQGERHWVPDWEPEILHPSETVWEEGQVFRTREEQGEAVWVITRLDRAQHRVEYHRVEPGRYVAHVAVRCQQSSDQLTRVSTAYSFVGLSEAGNREIASMTQEAYDLKISRWAEWINRHLEGERRQPSP